MALRADTPHARNGRPGMTAPQVAPEILFRQQALALHGSQEVAHFDRRAFKAKRIFASLCPTGETANLCLTPEQQEHWCGVLQGALSPVPNKWGARGWTEVRLPGIDPADLAVILRLAWANCGGEDRDRAKGAQRGENMP